ncbi:MAG: hypothetical protein C4522_12155, partial [Desulfobacteraceae bacterium]
DNDLNEVTGQAGVSIYTNSIQIVKTGVTTTYTDSDDEFGLDNDFNIVSEGTTTKIFFKGVDPLMIDIIDMETLDDYLANVGLMAADEDFGDTAVLITLPNAIEIQNVGSVKTYYAGAVHSRNEMITVTTTGGSTVISHADQGWGNPAGTYIQDDIWGNSDKVQGDHKDQVAILITAHEDL